MESYAKEILDQDLEAIFNLETDLFPCLVDMRFPRGESKREAAHQLKTVSCPEEEALLLKVKKETGIDTQIWAAKIDCQSF